MKIIRLIGRDSVEELILQRADEKLKLTNDVIEGGKFSLGTSNSGLAGNATQVKHVKIHRILVMKCCEFAAYWYRLSDYTQIRHHCAAKLGSPNC